METNKIVVNQTSAIMIALQVLEEGNYSDEIFLAIANVLEEVLEYDNTNLREITKFRYGYVVSLQNLY